MSEPHWLTLFGLPNLASASGNEASGAVSDTTPVGDVDDPEPAYPVVFVRPSRGVRDTYLSHIIAAGTKVNHVAVVGHNFQRGVAEWEVELWASTPDTPHFYATAAPDSFQGAVTNLSGVVSAIQDDPDDPDGSWLTATSASADTAVRFRVTSLSPATLQAGDREQELRLLVRRTNTGTPGAHPTLGVELWQNGSFVSTLLSGYSVSSTSGEVVSLLFNGNLLSGITNIEFRPTGTAVNGRTLEFGAAELRAYTVNADRLYRSGWQTIEANASNALFGDSVPITSGAEPRKIDFLSFADVSGAIAAVTKFRDPTNPDGYLSVGHVPYSYAWQPTLANYEPGGVVRPVDQTKVERTIGGVAAMQPVAVQREAVFALPGLTAEEAEQLALRAGLAVGTVRPYGVCFDPSSGFGRRLQTIWGRNAQGSIPAAEIKQGVERYRMAFRMQEA